MMKTRFILFVFLGSMMALLAACGLEFRTPIPDPILARTLPPPPTKSPTPQANVELVLTPSPSATPENGTVIFHDGFDGSMDAGWTWLKQYPASWNMTAAPGAVQLLAGSGYVFGASNSNVLVRPAPQGNFEVETAMNFRPNVNYQFAGLLIYASDQQYLQAGREFCSLEKVCSGDGLYFEYYNNGKFDSEKFAHMYGGDVDSVYLKVRREGKSYIFEGSADGTVWQEVGRRDVDFTPAYIGLFAGQNPNPRIPADFYYFEVRQLP